MSQEFESQIPKLWEVEMIKHLQRSPIAEMMEAHVKRQEMVIKSHMTKMERFLYEHFQNFKIKQFAKRKFHVESEFPDDSFYRVIKIYKGNKLIDKIVFDSKLVEIKKESK